MHGLYSFEGHKTHLFELGEPDAETNKAPLAYPPYIRRVQLRESPKVGTGRRTPRGSHVQRLLHLPTQAATHNEANLGEEEAQVQLLSARVTFTFRLSTLGPYLATTNQVAGIFQPIPLGHGTEREIVKTQVRLERMSECPAGRLPGY